MGPLWRCLALLLAACTTVAEAVQHQRHQSTSYRSSGSDWRSWKGNSSWKAPAPQEVVVKVELEKPTRSPDKTRKKGKKDKKKSKHRKRERASSSSSSGSSSESSSSTKRNEQLKKKKKKAKSQASGALKALELQELQEFRRQAEVQKIKDEVLASLGGTQRPGAKPGSSPTDPNAFTPKGKKLVLQQSRVLSADGTARCLLDAETTTDWASVEDQLSGTSMGDVRALHLQLCGASAPRAKSDAVQKIMAELQGQAD